MKKNLYELLEVPPNATQEQIKAAMIRLGKIYATKGQTNETARAHFNQIKAAYKILSNSYRRRGYDESLRLEQEGKRLTDEYFKKGATQGWEISKNGVMKLWQFSKQLLKKWKAGEQQALKGLKAGEQQVVKGFKMVQQRAATKYISNTLIPGEKIMYQAYTHWFFYLDFGAVLLVAVSSYLLIDNPPFIHENMPTVLLWVPHLISKDLLEISVWHLGLMVLLFIGLMMLWEVLIIKQTTELAITSKRVISKCGLLNRTIIELKLKRFESITIEQSLLGRLFNYGTITVTGMGGVKTSVPNIMAPLQFKKILWQVLEYVGHGSDEE